MFSVKVGTMRACLVFIPLLIMGCPADDVRDAGGGADVKDCGSVPDATADTGVGTDAAPDDDAAEPDAGEQTDTGCVMNTGRFETLASIEVGPRQETAVVALGGEVYVVGGYDDNLSFLPSLQIYDPVQDSWRSGADLPAPMHHANAAAVNGKLYVIGFLGSAFREDGRAFVYDPANDGWNAATPMPTTRQRGASVTVAHGGLIYLVGGLRAGRAVPDFDVYDPMDGSLRPLPPLPRGMDHGVGGALGNKIAVAGGRNSGIGAHEPDLDLYDLTSGEWSSGAPMPTSRGGCAAAVIGTRLYVFGGEGNPSSPVGLFDAVEVYDDATGAWSALTPMDPARHGMGAAAVGDRIYIPGGADVQAFGAVDFNEVFIP